VYQWEDEGAVAVDVEGARQDCGAGAIKRRVALTPGLLDGALLEHGLNGALDRLAIGINVDRDKSATCFTERDANAGVLATGPNARFNIGRQAGRNSVANPYRRTTRRARRSRGASCPEGLESRNSVARRALLRWLRMDYCYSKFDCGTLMDSPFPSFGKWDFGRSPQQRIRRNVEDISHLTWLGNLPVLGALFRSTSFQLGAPFCDSNCRSTQSPRPARLCA
jgi:hypothetical protein